MSYNTMKQSPKSCNGSWVSQTRSISDVILSLKTSFLDADFRAAVRELMEREEGLRREKEEVVVGLREKNDILEAEVGDLKMQKFVWEEERRRLRRDFDVNEDKLKDLARELSLVKEKEEKAIKRYDRLLNEVRVMEDEKVEFVRNLSDMSDLMDELKRLLRDKEGVIDELVREKNAQLNAHLEELEGVRRKNSCLEEEKQKFDSRLEELKREKEESIKELLERNEMEKRQVEAQLKAQKEELEAFGSINVSLREQKADAEFRVEELRRSDEENYGRIKKLMEEIESVEMKKKEIVEEKDEQIQELEKEREGLVVEKRELEVKLGLVEEKFSKLEGDVITCMCLDLGRDKRFSSTKFGKVLSGIIKALDSEENAGMFIDGNLQEADSAFNEPKSCLKTEKHSLESVKRTLDFEGEILREGGATVNKRTTCVDPIIIDSDDDNENLLQVNDVKNKRKCPGSLSERPNHDSSSDDDTLKPICKMQKLKHVLCEQVKLEPSVAALSTTIKQCEEKLRREDRGPICRFSKDVDMKGDDSKYSYGTPKADKLCSPRVEEYMTTLRQRKLNKKLECAADMFCALDLDADLCAKAVCALYRLWLSGMNGSNCFGSKGFEECDIERGTALAKLLIDGDPRGKMKKSVDDLRKDEILDCKRLAQKYHRQLIDIYRKGEDPLFSSSSTDLQYK